MSKGKRIRIGGITTVALPLHIPSKIIKPQMTDAEFDETSFESMSFYSVLSNEIYTDGDSDVFEYDADSYPNEYSTEHTF